MKISKVQIPTFIKNIALTAPLLFAVSSANAQDNSLKQDVFEKTTKYSNAPTLRVKGEKITPVAVIDISEQQLYHYNSEASLINTYPVRLCEDDLIPGLNTVEIQEKHKYSNGVEAEKVFLTKINKLNGDPKKLHKQVLVGGQDSNIYDDGIFTNVVLIDNDSAKKITSSLNGNEYILIKK